MNNNKQYQNAKNIVQTLQQAGYTALFAGGCVRDRLMGNEEYHDIDIATSAIPQDIVKLFDNVHAIGESFGVMLVVEDHIPFEVATFREDGGYQNGRHPDSVKFSGPKEDAKRRDFTINGMFFDPLTEEVHDFVGGEEDLKREVIATIGSAEDRFGEDYLRMLRAIRFAARFSFAIEEKTWDALCHLSHNIVFISQERILQEMTKMLTGPNPVLAIKLMQESGLLKAVLPEVASMVGVEQPEEFHPEGDVFEHTLHVLSHLPPDPSEALGWSALLHDVGKPPTQTFEDRIRFNNHHKVGADMVYSIMKRLKASNKLTDDVVACVENHMHFIAVQEMRKAKLKKFLARETIEDELLLHKADCLGSFGSLTNYDFLRAKQKEFAKEGLKPERFLGGKDLIALGLKPSDEFGKILNEAYDLQLEGDLISREDALIWLKKRIEA